jgi:hypothetical protein
VAWHRLVPPPADGRDLKRTLDQRLSAAIEGNPSLDPIPDDQCLVWNGRMSRVRPHPDQNRSLGGIRRSFRLHHQRPFPIMAVDGRRLSVRALLFQQLTGVREQQIVSICPNLFCVSPYHTLNYRRHRPIEAPPSASSEQDARDLANELDNLPLDTEKFESIEALREAFETVYSLEDYAAALAIDPGLRERLLVAR